MAITGKELKLQRIQADVRTQELAARLGVMPSQVSRWENSRFVTERAAERYLAALATFATNIASGTPAEVAS